MLVDAAMYVLLGLIIRYIKIGIETARMILDVLDRIDHCVCFSSLKSSDIPLSFSLPNDIPK
jgi:hypothetical protein